MTTINNLSALLLIAFFALLFGSMANVNPLWFGVPITIASVRIGNPVYNSGVLRVGVNKEIWLPMVMEGFYPNDAFLSRATDMSAFVENDVINLADAGVDPNVLINNTSYPLATAERTDTHLALPLDTYDSENTVVRNVEQMEAAYDKRASVMRQHQKAIRSKFSAKAAHSYAPSATATYTKVLGATGDDDGNGLCEILLEDINALAMWYDLMDFDTEGRCLVLDPRHKNQLIKQDKDLFKSFANLQTNQILKLFGFDVFVFSKTPRYHKTTGAKIAFGAAATGNDAYASFAFMDTEVMKADGTVDMFIREKDPEQRGDLIGFQKRGLALPIRNKGIASLYSKATA